VVAELLSDFQRVTARAFAGSRCRKGQDSFVPWMIIFAAGAVRDVFNPFSVK